MINNSIKNWQGQTVGFKCSECGSIVSAMWGDICNSCRGQERRHQELLKAIRNQQKYR